MAQQVRPQFHQEGDPSTGEDDRPVVGEAAEPAFDVGLGSTGRAVLWMTLLAALAVGVGAAGLRGGFLRQDVPRVVENGALRAWAGLVPIWTIPHRFPDVSPVTYTSFLVEARMWGTGGPRSATGFRLVNLLVHAAASMALLYLLWRLELPGAWVGAALFAVHPAAQATAGVVSERPALFGTLFGLLTLVVFLRVVGINPPSADPFRRLRLPESPWLLWVIVALLAGLTVAASPGIGAMLGPVALVICWWERGRLARRDLLAATPLLALTLLVLAAGVTLAVRHGGGDLRLEGVPGWLRPLAAVQQLAFYLAAALAPVGLRYAYEPFSIGWVATGVSAIALVSATVVACRVRKSFGRGPAAALMIFGLLLLPALIVVRQSDTLSGGWVGVTRPYPALAALVVALVAGVATALRSASFRQVATWLAPSAAVVAIGSAGALGARQAWLHRSEETLWQHVLERDPRSARAMVELADAALRDGDLTLAESHLTAAAGARGDWPEPWLRLGALEERRGRADRALSNYLQAASLSGDSFEAAFGVARAKAAKGDSTGALRDFEALLERRPNEATVLNNLGLLHVTRGDLPAAERVFGRAIEADPRQTAARVNLAQLLYRTGRPRDAEAQLNEAVRIDAGDPSVFLNAGAMAGHWATLRLQAGDPSDARRLLQASAAMLRKAVSLNPREAFAYYNLGVALVMLGDLPGVSLPDREGYFSEAEFAFGQAAQLDPKNATYPAHVELARARRAALQPPPP